MKTYAPLLSESYVPRLLDRFLGYASIGTQSDKHIEAIPSTPVQWDLARKLVSELKSLGLSDVELDEHCYLIARLPASPGMEGKPSIGLMAHMDTASDVPGSPVRPRVVRNYDGSRIELSPQVSLDPAEYPDLSNHKGDDIVVTDGTTLLGADDKAGLAEIVTAIEEMLKRPELKHGPIELFFTPDEETGKGMDLFPLAKARSTACYTFDGGKSPELETECFTAYAVKLDFKGKVIHIGAARGKLANATAMACHFVSLLPRSESPEATDGWYGYYCPTEIRGSLESASLDMYLRDFTSEGMQRRIDAVHAFAKAVEAQFPGGEVRVTVTKQYLNMKERLNQSPEVLARLEAAVRSVGEEPVIKPIRGGTDGSRLTEMGIPTPNVFTGGYNYHSRQEWASLGEMSLAVKTILELARLWAE
ncbi:MAG TPA: peptidase T [Rectinemataceae bacterium]